MGVWTVCRFNPIKKRGWCFWWGVLILKSTIWAFSCQMVALQNLWKTFFISSKKLFSFLRYSNFCNIFPSVLHFPDSKGQVGVDLFTMAWHVIVWAHPLFKGEAGKCILITFLGGKESEKLKKGVEVWYRGRSSGFDLTFQKWFLSFVNEANFKTDVKCCSSWVGSKDNFSL